MNPFLAAVMPIANLIESVVDEIRDSVSEPEIGSVVYCDLTFGYSEHTGIYIGNNQIVNLSGEGNIEIVSPKEFIADTTAMNILVSCRGTEAIGSKQVASRAEDMVNITRDYSFLMDNCHQFTSGCLNGDFEESHNFLWMVKDESAKILGSDNWRHWDINLID